MVNWSPAVRLESNPAVLLEDASRYVHGFAKELWVTECVMPVFGNQNVTEVPFGAVILLGLKMKLPGATAIFI